MKAITQFILCTMAFWVLSCSPTYVDIQVFSATKSNLKEESPLQYRGMEIGQIERIEDLGEGQFLYHCSVQPEVHIPEDSKFSIANTDIFGTQAMVVEFGTSEEYLTSNDQVHINTQAVSSSTLADPFQKELVEMLVSSAEMIQAFTAQSAAQNDSLIPADSLLFELRRLNDHLDQLNSKAE